MTKQILILLATAVRAFADLDFGPSVRTTEQLAVTKQADKWAIEYIQESLA
jgi:hypothetical protein